MTARDQIFAGRFVIEQQLDGQQAAVYRARDLETGADVALKLLRDAPKRAVARFTREAAVVADLEHPAIVRYVQHGLVDDTWYLATEWIDGVDLALLLETDPPNTSQSLAIAARVAEALAVAHAAGVVHRDIKPANLRLRGGNSEDVCVIDFGLAHLTDVTFTKAGVALGTPYYMAPEQVRGSGDVGPASDVFSLGALLYRCLTGQVPFDGENIVAVMAKIALGPAEPPSAVRPHLPDEIDALLAAMMAKDPAERLPDGAAAARAIAALVARLDADRTERAPPPTHLLAHLQDDGVDEELLATSSGSVTLADGRLTDRERRLVAVVIAPGAVDALDRTMTETEQASAETPQRVAEGLGAETVLLANGTMVAVYAGARGVIDLATRAARCALVLRERFAKLPLALSTGRAVVAGSIPIGEAIDCAVRLASAADPRGRPLLDVLTAGLLAERFDIDRSPSDDDDARLLGVERETSDVRLTLLGKPSPFVGRERELSRLVSAFEACEQERRPAAVLLSGEPGVGKSRLRLELLERLGASVPPARRWIARADALGAGSPFALLAQVIKRAADVREGEAASTRWSKLAARISAARTADSRGLGGGGGGGGEMSLEEVCEFLGELCGIPSEGTPSDRLLAARRDRALLGDQIRRAWLAFVAAECASAPLVLVLEDLQWGDGPSVRLVDAALSLSESPLFVLALARPEIHHTFARLWSQHGLEELRLRPLRARAARQMVTQFIDASDEQTIATLISRAEGNPLHIEELLRAASQGQSDPPATLLAMLQMRLEALEPQERRVLRAASVFGRTFWPSGVAQLCGDSEAHVLVVLADLERAELVLQRVHSRIEGQQEHVFRHVLVRDAAYAMLTDEDRRLGHQRAGLWLELVGEHDDVLLAEHFEQGADRERAARCYARAAHTALAGTDVAAAIARAERAIACGISGYELGELLHLQADAYYWSDDLIAAERCAVGAMQMLPSGDAGWYAAAAELATIRARRGDIAGLAALRKALDKLNDDNIAQQHVVSYARIAIALFLAGAYPAHDTLLARVSRAETQASRESARDTGGELLAQAWLDRARSLSVLRWGDPAGYVALVQSSREAFEHVGDQRNAYLQWSNLGYGYLLLGDYERARETLVELLPITERSAMLTLAAWCRQSLALALARLGDAPRGVRMATDSARAFERSGDRRLETRSRCYLSEIHLTAGDLQRAEEQARLAVERSRGLWPAHASALGRLARVLVRSARTLGAERAARAAEEALSAARRGIKAMQDLGGLEEGESSLRLALVESLLACDARAEALQALRASAELLVERAHRIDDIALRQRYLSLPEHLRLRELAGSLLEPTAIDLDLSPPRTLTDD